MAVAAAREPEDIFEAALDCLDASLGISRCSLLLFDDNNVMRFKAWRGLSDGYRAAVDGHSPWTPDTVDAQPIFCEDVRLDPSLEELRPTIEGEGIRALGFIPLTLGGRLMGKFMLYYGEPHVCDEIEVMTARTIAAHVAFALEQQAHRRSDERYRMLLEQTAVELRAANAAKDEFLGLVSHELKTPLTTIRGVAGVLRKHGDGLAPADRDAALDDIVKESERLHRIIENLLLLARAEQGHDLGHEPILVVWLASRVVDRHRQQYPERTYELVEDGDRRPVLFSEASLEQVLENLISNAEKYSPVDEPIVVNITRGDEVQLRVLDRGPGLAEEDMERLFSPFYRAATAPTHAAGLGIGLTVCKRLVEAHGGRMWAAPRKGGGSEFGFALPVDQAGTAES